jgi:RimJ/RimL family protein N-acetyltransferase
MRHPGRPRLTFRKVNRHESGELAAHLRRLDTADRHTRFLGGVSRAAVARHVASIDWGTAVLVGAWAGRALRGVGELHRLPGRPGEAEAAVTVERRFQGAGVGTELFRRLTIAARNRGVRRVHLRCLTENARAQRIARRLGAALWSQDGEIDATLRPLPPTFATLLLESLEDAETLAAQLRPLWRPSGASTAPREKGGTARTLAG